MQRRPAPMLVARASIRRGAVRGADASTAKARVAGNSADLALAAATSASAAASVGRQPRAARVAAPRGALASRPPPLHREAPPLVAHHSLLRGAARPPPPLPSKKASLRRHLRLRRRRPLAPLRLPAAGAGAGAPRSSPGSGRAPQYGARPALTIELVNERPVYRPAPRLPTSILAFDGGSATPSAAARKPTPDAAARAWRFAEIMSAGDG